MGVIKQEARRAYIAARTLLRYGTLYPAAVRMVESNQTIFIDAHDLRARKKLIRNPLRGKFPRNQRFWREAVAALEPAVALDVGFNYGECTFSCVYPRHTRVHGFEANSSLKPFIDQSLAAHPNRAQIAVHFVVACERSQGIQAFYVDRRWSGTSTVVTPGSDAVDAHYVRIEMPVMRVDDTVEAPASLDRPVLFKIDVEGYERHVLGGMTRIIGETPALVGFVEWDTALLEKAGTNVAAYWSWLQRHFAVYSFGGRSDALFPASGMALERMAALCKEDGAHTDLVLVRAPANSLVCSFVAKWTTAGNGS